MIRGSNFYYIKRADLENGLVKKKRYKGSDEWWIYRRKKSDIVNPMTNQPFDTDERYLHAIIVCKGDTKYSSDKKENESFAIVGERYTNDDAGYDLDHYLKETERAKE